MGRGFMREIMWLAAVLPMLGGCRGTLICEPPWSTQGQYVRVRNSEAYVNLVARAQSEVPHVACRAEAEISVQRRMWQESSSAQYRRVGGGRQSSLDAGERRFAETARRATARPQLAADGGG